MNNGMLKLTLVASAVLFSSLCVASPTSSQKNLMGEQASLGGGLFAREGQVGYYLDLRWQFNDYAEVAVGVDSALNGTTYSAYETFPDAMPADLSQEEFTEKYGSDRFRPRHNTFHLSTTLRYPFPLTESTILAPYAEFGVIRMSTKDVEFSAGTSGGNTDSSSQQEQGVRLSFESLGALKFGAGIQVGFSNTHRWALGAVSYSKDSDWSALGDSDSELGATLQYEYRPQRSFGVKLQLDTIDQFGEPTFSAGVKWAF